MGIALGLIFGIGILCALYFVKNPVVKSILWICMGAAGALFGAYMYSQGVHRVQAGVFGEVPTWVSLLVSLGVVVVNVFMLKSNLAKRHSPNEGEEGGQPRS